MSQSENKPYFNGQLIVEQLTRAADSEGRFRNNDERGEVAMIITNGSLEYVELAEFAHRGIRRGYHYHTAYTEQLYVISGKLYIAAEMLETGEKTLLEINAGDVIKIKPGVAHAFIALEKSLVLSMGSGADPFADRHRFTDITFPELKGEVTEKETV